MTSKELNELFFYNPSGWLEYKIRPKWSNLKLGERSGYLNEKGYRRIKIKGKSFLEHRLIWCYHNGYLPDVQLDHINGIRDDNRIENLRLCLNDNFDNQQNRKISKNNTSGHNGVVYNSEYKKYRVRIGINNKQIYLGSFSNLQDAIECRKNAEIKYHKFVN